MTKRNSPAGALGVEVTVKGRLAAAVVTQDGAPVEAEVRWWNKTPFRPTSGGEALLAIRDPHEFALTAARFERRDRLEVTARLQVGEDYIYSETVEIEIQG